MGNIVLLDDATINKIAAGEVIERPASVVKELVENSIDAGATNIVVEIKNGGKTFIKVTDNGKGILLEDMELALERHATSKIRKVEDLENTYTMGFRGEALASISSISNFTIITKTKEQMLGVKVISSAGKIISGEEVGIKNGTTMIVENLFFNTPVRYKFLKNDATEYKYIKDILQKIALSNINISFRFINDNKTVFFTSGNGKLEDVAYILFGKSIKENIVNVNYEDSNIKITGIVGNTLLAEKTRKNQIIFLNRRNIKNKTILNAADQAFVGGAGIGKHGFFVLNIEMPASEYDVNVHPTKTEVRFKDEDKIYKNVYYAVKEATLNKSFLGNEESENNKINYIDKEFNFQTNKFAPNEYFNKNNYFHNSENMIINNTNNGNILEKSSLNKNSDNSEKLDYEKDLDARKRENARKIEYKYLGIAFKTYIIIEIDNSIYLIDQHAAHERLLYEKIKENYKNNLTNDTQLMLFSELYDLSHKEFEFVKTNIELFKNVGFDIELFGSNSVKISGVPDLDYKVDKKEMFFDTLDEMLTNERSTNKNVEERFIATVACKSAVKAGMGLQEKEVRNLIDNLLVLKDPYTCPHGRPTTIKFDKNEMIPNMKNN